MLWGRRFPLSIYVALALYLALAATSIRAVGAVGEVYASWALRDPPRVAVTLPASEGSDAGAAGAALVWADPAHRAGPLIAAQVRPLESLDLGIARVPLSVNTYTGAPPDWPARALYWLTGSWRSVVALHVALGGLLIVLLHRFLRFHGTDVAAAVAALTLACDWGFLFYRKVLGGTELLLQAAGLLALWALWSRRWAGGRHGAAAIAVGIGLGLMAKVTFAATLIALGLAALLTRWDRPQLKAPPSPRWWVMAGAVLALTSPLWITWLHRSALPLEPRIVSHDDLALQWGRLWGGLERLVEGLRSGEGAGVAREPPTTLIWFLVDPLAWFEPAWRTSPGPGPSPWRLAGWGLLAAGTALEWRSRYGSKQAALLRFVSIYAPLQVGALWVLNRDLHHLAQATPTLCLWFGLAADRLGAVLTQPRSPARALHGLLYSLPWMLAGAGWIRATDPLIASSSLPHLREDGQAALAALLRAHDVRSLWACDYDLYGTLEIVLQEDGGPPVDVHHAWGAVSRRAERRQVQLQQTLAAARGGHVLFVEPAAARIYDLHPEPSKVRTAASLAGLEVSLVDALEGDAGQPWARLYRVE